MTATEAADARRVFLKSKAKTKIICKCQESATEQRKRQRKVFARWKIDVVDGDKSVQITIKYTSQYVVHKQQWEHKRVLYLI